VWVATRSTECASGALGVQAGIELVDEATEDDLLVDVEKLAELGVKNKKHLKKLSKLTKETKKKQKKKTRAAKQDEL
jgi:dephospho-CoA kinase